MKGLRPKIQLSQWLTMTKGSTPSPKSKLQLRKCQSLRISMSRTKTIKNSYLFLIFLRHSYNLNFREDIQSDEATGGWNRVILSDFSWRVASIQESFQTSLVWPCADSADCTWDKHRLAVTSRQERHRDMCVDEFNKNNLTTEEKQRQILGSPKLNKPNREVVVLSCTLLYYIWSILHCIGIFGNHWIPGFDGFDGFGMCF